MLVCRGDTLEDCNKKCKWYKYGAGKRELFLHCRNQGRQPDGHLNWVFKYNLEFSRKGEGLPKRGNSVGNSVEMRNYEVEDGHGSQLVLGKAWERRVENEAREIRRRSDVRMSVYLSFSAAE